MFKTMLSREQYVVSNFSKEPGKLGRSGCSPLQHMCNPERVVLSRLLPAVFAVSEHTSGIDASRAAEMLMDAARVPVLRRVRSLRQQLPGDADDPVRLRP